MLKWEKLSVGFNSSLEQFEKWLPHVTTLAHEEQAIPCL